MKNLLYLSFLVFLSCGVNSTSKFNNDMSYTEKQSYKASEVQDSFEGGDGRKITKRGIDKVLKAAGFTNQDSGKQLVTKVSSIKWAKLFMPKF